MMTLVGQLSGISILCAATWLGCGESRPTPHGSSPSVPWRLSTLPIAEVSGLATLPGAPAELVAVGDDTASIARFPGVVGAGLREAMKVALPKLKAKSAGLEAIATDAAGRVYVMSEGSGRITRYDLGDGKKKAKHELRWQLDVGGHPIAKRWKAAENARGEGLLVLGADRFLVAKQRKPRLLIEFGPAGAQPIGVRQGKVQSAGRAAGGKIVPLSTWELAVEARDHFEDLSDLARGPDGQLYVISSRSARVGRIVLPLSSSADTFEIDKGWDLPALGEPGDELKPEGLTFLPDRSVVVGFDRDFGKPNLLWMPPLTEPKSP